MPVTNKAGPASSCIPCKRFNGSRTTVVAPIASITDGKGKYEFAQFDILNKLRMQLQEVQYGEAEDKHGWMVEVSC